jgi:hypothetical protein
VEHSDILSALVSNSFKDMRFVIIAWEWLYHSTQQCRISIFDSSGKAHFRFKFKLGARELKWLLELPLRWALPSEELQQQLLEPLRQLLQALHKEY